MSSTPQSCWEQLLTQHPDGSDDPAIAAEMRAARAEHIGPQPAPKGVTGPRGEFIPQTEWGNMTAGERRGATVGNTCSHYEHDVPGMSDWHK